MTGLERVGGLPFPAHASTDEPRSHLTMSAYRTRVLMVLARCTVCGHPLGNDARRWGWVLASALPPVLLSTLGAATAAALRGVAGPDAVMVEEGAGHEACMVYSFAACPFLASDAWHYRRDETLTDLDRRDAARSGGKVLVSSERFQAQSTASGSLALALFDDVRLHRYPRGRTLQVLADAAAEPVPADDTILKALRTADEAAVAIAVVMGLSEGGPPDRNDKCPCESGRKWKQCHQTQWPVIDALARAMRDRRPNKEARPFEWAAGAVQRRR